MAELLGVIEQAHDARTITSREHTTERRRNRMPVIVAVDADAQAFIDAAGLTDPMQLDAVNGLVVDLKAAGVWDLLFAAWPMVGGTAFAHSLNMVDPRDADDAYRLSFTGTWAHTATGAAPDGSTAHADTHLDAGGTLSATSGSVGFYSRTAAGMSGQPYDVGCDDGDSNPLIVIARYSSGNAYLCYGDATSAFVPNVASSDGTGLWATNRIDAVTTRGYRNGVQITSANVGVALPNRHIYLGANNRAGSPTYHSTKEHAFDFVAQGLTPAQHLALYDAVQNYQSTLARSV